MPVELYIIDVLWTLLVGKVLDSRADLFEYAAATQFKKSVFNNDSDLYAGTDFSSYRMFKNHIMNYILIGETKHLMFLMNSQNILNTALLCLDMKNFYYSTEFNFSLLRTLIDEDDKLDSIDFLTSLVEHIYSKYTNLLSKYKKGVVSKDNSYIFPLGLISTYILRELYLNQFDRNIVDSLTPLYYNRYVDDILIVIDIGEDNSNSTQNEIIQKYLIDTNILRMVNGENGTDYALNGYNIRIQREKINCFFFFKEHRAILLDVYKQVIDMNSSEANLLPDLNVLDVSFTQSVYNIKNLEISNKIRDIGFLQSNNYNATKFINALQRIIKNAQIAQDFMVDYYEDIFEFYNGSQSIEFSNNWQSIFELFVLAG